jgi:hypothetical protein
VARGERRHAIEIVRLEPCTGRVVGIADDDKARPRLECALETVDIHAPAPAVVDERPFDGRAEGGNPICM